MKKPKNDTTDEFVMIMNGDQAEMISLPTVVMRLLRRLYDENDLLRRRLDEIQGPPEPKQKRAYRKRDNGADVAVVADEGSP